MTTTTIPAPIARMLRSGAYMTLSLAADSMSVAVGSSERPTGHAQADSPEPAPARLERVRALLDALGWQDSDATVTLEVEADLEPHRRALAEAMWLAGRRERLTGEQLGNMMQDPALARLLTDLHAEGQALAVPDPGTERLVVLQLLDGEHSFETLRETLDDIDPDAIRAALANLHAAGVATASGDSRFWASRCAQHMEALHMISV
jgi:hypothetical protein